jgi:hypothetical protein
MKTNHSFIKIKWLALFFKSSTQLLFSKVQKKTDLKHKVVFDPLMHVMC